MIAISTAFKDALIAVEKEGVTEFATLDSNSKHSENVLATLAEMLDRNNLKLAAHDDIAVVVGPGSFTGVRIGVALVKGLCAGIGIKQVKAITTFDLLAYVYYKATGAEKFTVAIDALSDLVFVCDYENGKKKGSERLISTAELQGKQIVTSLFDELGGETVQLCPQDLLDCAKLNGNVVKVDELQPLYLRLSQAEASLEQKNAKNV